MLNIEKKLDNKMTIALLFKLESLICFSKGNRDCDFLSPVLSVLFYSNNTICGGEKQ